MLLAALHQFAEAKGLLADLPFQRRTVHAFIDLHPKGDLRCDWLVALTRTERTASGKEIESIGHLRVMPRFPGENNGGKAYFLADSASTILGCDKVTGEPIWTDIAKGKNPTKAFQHFWQQIVAAEKATGDYRLQAILSFRERYLLEKEGRLVANLPFLKTRNSSRGASEWVAIVDANLEKPLKDWTLAFRVGDPVTLDDPDDRLRHYWRMSYTQLAFKSDDEDTDDERHEVGDIGRVCLVSGQVGQPIARSHKPKILGLPGLASGGYIVSFAKQSPAFSSFGFEMGENAPVAESVAANYALALNHLLKSDDHHLTIGPMTVCVWAKRDQAEASTVKRMLLEGLPRVAIKQMNAVFAARAPRPDLVDDRLHSVALSANAGRVVVRHWLQISLRDAYKNLKQWFDDLEIVALYQKVGVEPRSYRGLKELARLTIRRSKKHGDDKLQAESVTYLYRAAIEGTSLPLSLLSPLLQEFHSLLVKNSEQEPTYPFATARFALIKLILLRHHQPGRGAQENSFMPPSELAETNDRAYNCGRLLALLDAVQREYHIINGKERIGADIIDRYYGMASTAPVLVIPNLLKLAQKHLGKLSRVYGEDIEESEKKSGGHDSASPSENPNKRRHEKKRRRVRWLNSQIERVLSLFQPEGQDNAPSFPRLLSLEEQGRFALGFYQQRASRHAKSANKDSNQPAPPTDSPPVSP